MIAAAAGGRHERRPLKDYLIRRVRTDGGREIVADTALLSEARAFPALLDAGGTVRHDCVESATGRVVYPGAPDGAWPID